MSTIPELVRRSAARFGDAPAIEDGGATLSYRALAALCDRAGRAFVAAGIRPGDRVAVWAPNRYEWIAAAVGAQAAGAVLVPLNTRFKAAEARYILAASGARAVCTVGAFLGANYAAIVDGVRGELPALERVIRIDTPAWEELLTAGEGAALPDVGADDLSDILFTSGTTGNPKGVMTTHAQNLRAFGAWTDVVGLRAGDRYLIVNPFFHAFGYKAGWLSAIMRGATILPHPVFDAAAVLARIGRDRVTILPGPPALYQSILANPERASYDLSSLRLAVTGAASIPVDLIERMRDELGFETVITGYGLTEACGVATMCRFDDDPKTIATTSGRALPDVEVRCVDAGGAEVPRGQPGEVVVRGYNVMRGYLDDAAATAEAIDRDGWLHTGDIGVMDDRGYLRITDRVKDMFIVGGFNCYPAEIENLMLRNRALAQVAVIGAPDERLGQVPVAYVVLAPGAATSADAIVAWCRDEIANYKCPRRVEIVDALPMNATGKVTKFALRDRERERTSNA
jgi:acyl-CoA synthetase (AMP-forming)/AMP-acid ligase II